MGLEDDLSDELHVEGFARPDAGSPVEVANCIGHFPESARIRTLEWIRCRRIGCATAAYGSGPGSKVDAVKEVENLGAKLDPDPLVDRDVFNNREVHISVTGAVELVASQVARTRAGSIGARKRRRIPPLFSAIRGRESMCNSGVRVAN